MRKILTFLFAALMSVGMWAVPATCGDGLTWSYSSNTLTISYDGQGTGVMDDYDEVNSYANYPWLAFKDDITTVVIEEGVTTIGEMACDQMTNLESVSLPSTLLSIKDAAFEYCAKLQSITLPSGLTSIGLYAFYGCEALTSINIPSGVTDLPEMSLYGCYALQTVTLPEGLLTIGKMAFMYSDLLSITLPSTLTSIGQEAFRGSDKLANITMLSTTPPTLGNWAFAQCASGLTFTVPTCELIDTYAAAGYDTYMSAYAVYSPTTIVSVTGSCGGSTPVAPAWLLPGDEWDDATKTLTVNSNPIDYAYSGGVSVIENLVISDAVTSIGASAFAECTGLTSITIPNNVTSIGVGAFAACSGLTSMVVASGNTKYDSRGNCNAIIETSTNTLIAGCQNTIIPNSVTSIGLGAFLGCTGLTSITIPSSVTSIGDGAFQSCEGLTSIEIPNSVTSIGQAAFYGCTGLTSVTIGNSVTSIGMGAFLYCTSLESVTINAESLESYGDYAFEGTAAALKIYVPAGSVATYKAGWAEYEDKIVAIGGGSTPTDEQVPTNADPENPSYYYSTFFHSTQNYKLTNDGTTAFIADLSGSDLILTEIAKGSQVIPANTAVILRKAGSAEPVVLNPTEENGVSVNPEDNDLEGVDAITAVTSIDGLTRDNCYVLSGQQSVGFYLINSDNLKAHKAYVKYVSTPGQNNAPKKMRFVFNTTTGVESAQPSVISGQKLIENGQLIIIKNGVRYNAQGQIVK